MEGAPRCESCVWRRAATPHFLLACAPRVCLAVSGAPLRGGPWALGAGAAADEGVDAWPGRVGGGGMCLSPGALDRVPPFGTGDN